MKKFINLIVAMSAILLFAAPISSIAAGIVAAAPLTLAPSVAAIGHGIYTKLFSDLKNPFVLRAVEVEIWGDYIMNNLFKGVEFLKNCFRADSYVLKGKVVHIPQAGAKPNVVINRTAISTASVRRTDTDVVYPLDEYSTDPTLIEDAANVQLSYDKMDSVLGDHIGVLNETVCDSTLNKWAPTVAGQIIRTSGATLYPAHLTAATGTRKGFTLADLKRAKVVLDKQKVPALDRYAIMSVDMWAQLEDQLTVTPTRDYSKLVNEADGTIAILYGFKIVVTPNVVVYDNSATPAVRAYGALGAITDNDAVLCYQKNMVELALGEIKFFEQTNSPNSYGDIYSCLVRAGARKRYANDIGIVAIVQAP